MLLRKSFSTRSLNFFFFIETSMKRLKPLAWFLFCGNPLNPYLMWFVLWYFYLIAFQIFPRNNIIASSSPPPFFLSRWYTKCDKFNISSNIKLIYTDDVLCMLDRRDAHIVKRKEGSVDCSRRTSIAIRPSQLMRIDMWQAHESLDVPSSRYKQTLPNEENLLTH